MGYPAERREAILKKMLPPNNKTIKALSEEEGIAEATLYNWRKAARAEGRLMPEGDSTAEGWSAADKFAAVVETVALNEVELSVYCREKGLYPEQIRQWRSRRSPPSPTTRPASLTRRRGLAALPALCAVRQSSAPGSATAMRYAAGRSR